MTLTGSQRRKGAGSSMGVQGKATGEDRSTFFLYS